MSRILGPDSYRRRAWKNGLGTTVDLASDAPGSEKDWTWRLSIADVPGPARFSEFPGVDRLLLCLEGPGLRVERGGKVGVVPRRGDALVFAGEEKVRGEPLGPGVRDANLMLRRDRWRGRMTLLRGGSLTVEGRVILVHAPASSPAVRVAAEGAETALPPGSTFVTRGRAVVCAGPAGAAVVCAILGKKKQPQVRRPTRAQLEAARKKTVKDVIRPGLNILWVGINPGLYTAAIGHHFGRPGNRFWPALNRSGLLREPLTPWESERLLESNLGITNVVKRATPAADELTPDELHRGARALRAKIRRYKPKLAAFLGLGLYRVAFKKPAAKLGLQAEKIGDTRLYVLPNPSGLNAHFQMPDYARLFRAMGRLVRERPGRLGARPRRSSPPRRR